MPIYSRILVAIDHSDVSPLVIQEAIKLAKDQKAVLYIIYIADEFIPAGEGVLIDFKQHEKSIRKSSRSLLKKMTGAVCKQNISFESHLIEISEPNVKISEKIIEQAIKYQSDLILLGTHGREGLSRLLLGSVAEEVTRNTSIPVQLIKTQKK